MLAPIDGSLNTHSPEGIRAKLVRWTCRTPVVWALERLTRRPGLTVIGYHRIGDPAESPYDPDVFDCSPEQLNQQISYLKSHFRVVELQEAQELISHPERLRHPHVLLTFDDGYLDNYEVAFPILRSNGVQGTFFLPTSFIGTDRLPWWDQVAFMVRNSRTNRIVLQHPWPVLIELSATDVVPAIRQILALYKAPGTTDVASFLNGLAETCGVDIPHAAVKRQVMNWTEAGELVRGGMALGSHTHRHELLAKLSPEEQFKELGQSRQILENRVGVQVNALAYPVGSRTSFSAATWEALDRTGYRTAFSYYGGVNRPGRIQRFDVVRLKVCRGLSFPSFRLGLATASVAGTKSLFRKRYSEWK
jgi:peptidoglycan/xylan/chitin deacetylase (PgdA/CDA1 family)